MTKQRKKEKEDKNLRYKPSRVGETIKQCRKIRGISMKEMAEALERDYYSYEQIETGASTTVDMMMVIAEKLDVTVDYLLKNDLMVTKERMDRHPYYNYSYMTQAGEIEVNDKRGMLEE